MKVGLGEGNFIQGKDVMFYSNWIATPNTLVSPKQFFPFMCVLGAAISKIFHYVVYILQSKHQHIIISHNYLK